MYALFEAVEAGRSAESRTAVRCVSARIHRPCHRHHHRGGCGPARPVARLGAALQQESTPLRSISCAEEQVGAQALLTVICLLVSSSEAGGDCGLCATDWLL
jgi:hypothetical protein